VKFALPMQLQLLGLLELSFREIASAYVVAEEQA
jgi:hypothetical protein